MTAKRSREAIAVSAEVKDGLGVVNNLLEQQLGSRLSYNEVIAFLLLQYNKSDRNNQLDMFDSKHEEPMAELADEMSDEQPYGEFSAL